MAEVEGTTTQEKSIEDAKKRISQGKGTPEDFKLVGQSLVSAAKTAQKTPQQIQDATANPGQQQVSVRNPATPPVPAQSTFGVPAGRPQTAVSSFPDLSFVDQNVNLGTNEFPIQPGYDAPPTFQQMRSGAISRMMNVPANDLLAQKKILADQLATVAGTDPASAKAIQTKIDLMDEAIRTRDAASRTPINPAETVPSKPVLPATAFGGSGTLSGGHKASSAPSEGGPLNQSPEETPKMKQVSDIVDNLKQLDPVTIWDILEGGLKGWSGNFDTARKQKVAAYRESEKDFNKSMEDRNKEAENREFQKSMLDEQLKQERELSEKQFAFQSSEADEARAAKLQEMGYDRETALMLAKMQRPQTTTPQQIAASALGSR